MTTIAFDGKTIAADGMRTWGSEIRGLDFKKMKVESGSVYAFTGLAPMFSVMVAWHRSGADPEKLPKQGTDEGWTLIVVDGQGLGKFTSGCPYIERFDPPIAFGAGQDYAIGAMLAGADARKAVEVVASICNHTGGEIQVIDIASVLNPEIKVAAE